MIIIDALMSWPVVLAGRHQAPNVLYKTEHADGRSAWIIRPPNVSTFSLLFVFITIRSVPHGY